MIAHQTIPRLTIQPEKGFVPFKNEEIEQSIPQRFEQQVRNHGDRLAIKTTREALTFTALDQSANRIARAILSRRGDAAEPIALLFDRGAAVLVALLAVLKSGKFYVVLDASYPRDRLEYMLGDSGAKLIVTDSSNLALAWQLSGDAVDVIDCADVDMGLPDDDLGVYPAPDSLALLLYTSGSTGQPKGAMEPLLGADLDYFNEHFSPRCILAHALGPTECLTVCWTLIPHGTRITQSKLPIGYPLEDKEVLVLDESGRELEDGAVGELAVKSRYISPGYWRDPERTKATFLSDPMGSDARIYLTGDLGMRGHDGCLIHVGREDFQVKIRGFRIDVSEVEVALHALEDVGDAVVVGRSGSLGAPRLVAYFVPSTKPPITVTKLRQCLVRVLPDYMIPSAFVAMDALPKTPNGKTDRLRLPLPTRDRPNMDNRFMPPETAMETEMAAIWAEVLDLDYVGIHDNFFELGGDSLLATKIISRVIGRFQVELPIKTLLEAPT